MKGGLDWRRCDVKQSNKTLAFLLTLGLMLAFVGGLSAEETGKVNINNASLEELSQLKRVGPKYAERIIEYRESHGAFKQVEDITNVPGIGPKTLEVNKDIITVK
jgi:competence protein ComEA